MNISKIITMCRGEQINSEKKKTWNISFETVDKKPKAAWGKKEEEEETNSVIKAL